MIKKTVDYWVADFKTPSDSDLYDAIVAARREKAVVMLHWHTPAYPYFGSSSDMTIEVCDDDNVENLKELLSKIIYAV